MKTENINGFIWAIVPFEEAKENFQNEHYYSLYPDGSESYLEDLEELLEIEDSDARVGIEIGAEEELTADYLEAMERFNESRTFEDWCLSKIE